MKKSIGILIAAIMLLSTTCGLCDSDSSSIPFTAVLTSTVAPDSAIEIIADETQRAILTVCLALDFAISDGGKDFMSSNLSTFLFNDSYVASNGSFLVVSGHAKGKCLNLFYEPDTKEASYYIVDSGMSDDLMDILVKSAAETLPLHYKNDVVQLLTVMDAIKEAISD